MNMKIFWQKLGSSFALDREPTARGDVKGGREEGTGNGFASLDQRLRASRPAGLANANLHSGIMRAVRAQVGGRPKSAPFDWMGWAAATACLLLLGLGVWKANRPATVDQAAAELREPTFSVALDQGMRFTQQAPEVALAPLVGELELLNRDARAALDHVVATLP